MIVVSGAAGSDCSRLPGRENDEGAGGASRAPPAPPSTPSADWRDVDGFGTLCPFARFVLHARAIRQCPEAGGHDVRVMHEQVLAAFVGRDEAVALRVVEPLHGPGRHPATSQVERRKRTWQRGLKALTCEVRSPTVAGRRPKASTGARKGSDPLRALSASEVFGQDRVRGEGRGEALDLDFALDPFDLAEMLDERAPIVGQPPIEAAHLEGGSAAAPRPLAVRTA